MRRTFIFLMLLSVLGCRQSTDKYDSPQKGTINISVDESFRPVIEEQIRMYHHSYPGTQINASYKTEADCFKDLYFDSATRMIIVTRGLSEKEEKFFRDSLNYVPSWNPVATDAIAVIVNASDPDTLFTLSELKERLSGKLKDRQIVFDGLNATATVRYVMDSIMKGEPFDTSVVKAAKSSRGVIDHVGASSNAIGLIGINHIGNPEDQEQVQLLKKVRIAYLMCEDCEGKPYVKPIQESIMFGRYPMVRGLYYINKENYTGLGSGFSAFLKNERGQLIFRRAYLSPVMELKIRRVNINDKLPY